MNHLGMTRADLEKAGGYWTAREIAQQPLVWTRIEGLMARAAAARGAFLDPLLQRPELRIVLTGAGSSAFVGQCLAPALTRAGRRVSAVATTDLCASPASWFPRREPLLLVSFARSGNSPESLAALNLAAHAACECHHLIVTCNREGALYARGAGAGNVHVVLLPEEANDRGFAMTSSFSGMLLAAALAFGLVPANPGPAPFARWASRVLDAGFQLIAALARSGFERVVYLGSNELKGLAREAALKMLELSDGRVVAVAETPMGFRHGPKSIVNGKTLIVMFLCNDPHTRRYEIDVLNELRADGVAGRVVALSAACSPGAAQSSPATAQPFPTLPQEPGPASDDGFIVAESWAAPDLGLCFPYAVFAQSLAFMQSLALALRPDQPNARGVVNRVVQGVTIYPWDAGR